MSLSTKTKQALKAQAHPLNPVVMIGKQALTPAVIKEINIALDHHELIKIKVQCEDRDLRRSIIRETCDETQAELVQSIGSIAVLYRKRVE